MIAFSVPVEFNNSESKLGKKALLEKALEEFAYDWQRFRKRKLKEVKIKGAFMGLTQFTKCLCVLDMLALILLSRSSSYE